MEIKIVGVSKHFEVSGTRVDALSDVNMDISKGDYVALTGPTGSGKTTLLSVMGTLLTPSKGSVYYDNSKISGLRSEKKIARLRRSSLSFAFQYPELLSHLTVLENILMPYIFKGRVTKQMEEEAVNYIQRLNLSKKINHPATALSGGERRKVGIIRSIMYKPKVLFIDEPTDDLDPDSEKEVMDIFNEINASGISIVLVTHSMEFAMQAKSVYELKQGKIVNLLK